MCFLRFSLYIALVLPLSACLVTPSLEEPVVLEPDEFQLLSTIKRGRDYALGGQAELAEVQYREALKDAPESVHLHNDLGYVLLAQNRYEEATQVFRRAFELEPNSSVVRENLARTYYADGDLEMARAQYEQLVEWAFRVNFSELPNNISRNFQPQDLLSVYRSLSLIYFVLGNIDEARCLSRLALAYNFKVTEVTRHVRLLLSLDEVDAAVHNLRLAIAAPDGRVSGKLLLDYSLAYLAKGDYNLARQAAGRLLAQPQTGYDERLQARMLLLTILSREGEVEEAEFLFKALVEEEPDFCEEELTDPDSYWPLTARNDVEAVLKSWCADEVESFSSPTG